MGNGKRRGTSRLSSRTSDNAYCVNLPFPADPPHTDDAPETVAEPGSHESRWKALAGWASRQRGGGLASAGAAATRGRPRVHDNQVTGVGAKKL